MEVLKENQLQLSVCGSKPSSFQDLLLSQKKLVHCQIDKLQSIVVKQCNLTGVNPLSQEMAAGALSIKIGKRPRDLLNPKAVKYMQSVFSIKDAITKKESREISALFGVTVTQVRDFFTSQRSRVRKFVRLSRDKSLRSNTSMEVLEGDPMKTDPSMSIYPVSLIAQDVVPVYAEPTIPTNPVPLKMQDGVSMDMEPTMPTLTVPLKMQAGVPIPTNPSMPIYPVLLNSAGPVSGEGPSCSTEEETLPGLDGPNRHFVENIFDWMWKEETFSGQVKLMEQIVQIQNCSILYWFLTKGGVTILVTWLRQAASEEQTSVVDVVLKVLSHLPLHKALPAHMSAILQSVNSLRFYRKSDISNRARFLLSRWSKIFARSQAMKKPNAGKSSSDAQTETMLKQSICEIMGAESRESKIDIREDTIASSFEGSENFRKVMPTPVDDSTKKLIRGVSSSQCRERRKVLLVEQPGQKSSGRSMPVARSVTASQGRPLSADDIQKAKMRAQFMQSKYGKSGASSSHGHQVKTEGPIRISSSTSRTFLTVSKAYVRPQVEGHKVLPPQGSVQQANKKNLDIYEPLWKKCKRVQIRWQTPAELTIPYAWSVGTGENSKEIEVQRNRISREKETIYRTSQEIPLVPKEPWDHEMEYDDSLTPEIPTEQLPDCDGVETVVFPCESESNNAVTVLPESIQNSNENVAEPDLDLLAVLLENPELVFALTSGQSVGSLSSEETVKLLDMIKAKGIAASQNTSLDGRRNIAKVENVPVCLPSPTPSNDPVTSGWRPLEVSKNTFCRQSATSNRETIAVSIPSQENLSQPGMTQCSTNFLLENRLHPHDFSRSAPTSSHMENIISLGNSPLPPNLVTMRTETSSGYVKPPPMSIMPSPAPLPPQRTPAEPGSFHLRANENNYYNTYDHRRTQLVDSRSEYESWSPQNSPTRSPAECIMPGWGYPEQRMNMRGRNHRAEHEHHHHRSRTPPPQPPPRHSSSWRENNYDRHAKRSWRDDRRK